MTQADHFDSKNEYREENRCLDCSAIRAVETHTSRSNTLEYGYVEYDLVQVIDIGVPTCI